MKRLLVAIAIAPIALFAAGAGADDVYRGLAKGSPDLYEPHAPADAAVGVQPGVGDSAAPYGRAGERNPGLFPGARTGGADNRPGSWARDIYPGFCGGNPALNC
jgi:hypothetical protein